VISPADTAAATATPLRSYDPHHLIEHLPWVIGVDEHGPDPARIEAAATERQPMAVGVDDRSDVDRNAGLGLLRHRQGTIEADHMTGSNGEAGEIGTGAAAEIEHPVAAADA